MDSETQSAAVSAKKKGKKKNKKTLRKVVTVLVVVLLVGGVIFACMPKGAAGMGTAVYKNDVFTVTRGEVYDTISATGLIESSEDTTAKVHSTLTYKIGTVIRSARAMCSACTIPRRWRGRFASGSCP